MNLFDRCCSNVTGLSKKHNYVVVGTRNEGTAAAIRPGVDCPTDGYASFPHTKIGGNPKAYGESAQGDFESAEK